MIMTMTPCGPAVREKYLFHQIYRVRSTVCSSRHRPINNNKKSHAKSSAHRTNLNVRHEVGLGQQDGHRPRHPIERVFDLLLGDVPARLLGSSPSALQHLLLLSVHVQNRDPVRGVFLEGGQGGGGGQEGAWAAVGGKARGKGNYT